MIRHANEGDVGRLLDMGRRFHATSVYGQHVPFDAVAVRDALRLFIAAKHAAVLVSERDGEVTGAIGGIVGPHFVAGFKSACELFWWVEPESRGQGLRLLAAYEDEAQKLGAKRSSMIAPLGAAGVKTVYERLGYRHVESVYMRALG